MSPNSSGAGHILSLVSSVFALAVLEESSHAVCTSKVVLKEPDQYIGCKVTFTVKDIKTFEVIEVSHVHGPKLLPQEVCEVFCSSYLKKVESLNKLEKKLNVSKEDEKSGATNTIPIYGVYDHVLDLTTGFGAFDDLMKFGFGSQGGMNLDIGGGRFNETSAYLSVFGIENRVFDPFTRSPAHNDQVMLNRGKYDSATSISVLNVIQDRSERRSHIQLAYDSVKVGAKVYFKVYEGDQSGKASGFHNNQLTERYLDEVQEVFGVSNVIFHPKQCLLIGEKKAPISTE